MESEAFPFINMGNDPECRKGFWGILMHTKPMLAYSSTSDYYSVFKWIKVGVSGVFKTNTDPSSTYLEVSRQAYSFIPLQNLLVQELSNFLTPRTLVIYADPLSIFII